MLPYHCSGNTRFMHVDYRPSPAGIARIYQRKTRNGAARQKKGDRGGEVATTRSRRQLSRVRRKLADREAGSPATRLTTGQSRSGASRRSSMPAASQMRSRLPSTLARCARSGRSGSDEKAGNGCGAGADTTTAHGRLMLTVLGASTTSRNPDPAVILAGGAIGHGWGGAGGGPLLPISG